MILHWQPFLEKYYGWWINGPDSVDALFDYHPTTALATSTSNISLDAWIDWGTWLPSVIPLPPKLLYTAASFAATDYQWRAALTITG